jgi:hypothetical protein
MANIYLRGSFKTGFPQGLKRTKLSLGTRHPEQYDDEYSFPAV